MKAHLMYRDRDFARDAVLPGNADDLSTDLELEVLLDAMAAGDGIVRSAARAALLRSMVDPDDIAYRQEVLADCLGFPAEVRGLFELVVESIDGEKQARWWGYGSGRFPTSILSAALRILDYYTGELRRLRDRAEELASKFTSTAFVRLCSTLARELSDDYMAELRRHMMVLEFRHGVLISSDLSEGMKGSHYVVRRPNRTNRPWIERIFRKKQESYTYTVPDRDDVGAKALSELRDRGINPVANAVAQSADHVRSFYALLRDELAFYIGCLNLQERLTGLEEPICLPRVSDRSASRRSFEGLYDVCLALTTNREVVGNDVNADGCRLVVITGANHGGKSTFLRSVGISQLMMQCGMFVCARSYEGSVVSSLFTHFKRREDVEMESGKFDEELKRMSEIADQLSSGAFVLFNESFAATNEREGSEIARQVVRALVENGVSVYFVTHQYDFAKSMFAFPPVTSLFLRAERRPDGSRSYKLVEAPPLETSYGKDLYRDVFGQGGVRQITDTPGETSPFATDKTADHGRNGRGSAGDGSVIDAKHAKRL